MCMDWPWARTPVPRAHLYLPTAILLLNGVAEYGESGDFNLDDIAGLHGSDAGGSAGGDQVSGLERHALRDVVNQVWNGEDEVAGFTALFHLTIEARDQQDVFSAWVDFI